MTAAARVLARRGYAATSTNHIAAKAGVSIGSLYEYFRDKDAIFTALHHAHLDDAERAIRSAFDDVEARAASGHVPLAAMVRQLVMASVEAHAKEPTVHHRLSTEVPQVPAVRRRVAALEQETFARLLELLRDHPEVDVPNLQVAVTLALQAVEALVHRWVAEQQQSDAADLASSELVRLVVGYLRG